MTAFDSSVITHPFNISVVTSNGTDQLKTLIAPSWVGAPNVRGTMDILRSCILTLVACIYTALHLDVPRKTTWQYLLWEKSKWVLVTLFAPEIAVYMAASQLRYAWRLKLELQKIQKKTQGSERTTDVDFDINLKYCFFIVMGAVRFSVHDMLSLPDLNEKDQKYFEHGDQHSVRPGPAAIIWLAERGHWIRIRKENIDDKSKANTIQKALVLLQVSWMVTQCIARRKYNLPLSLLEIHTVVHVACAVFLYACWLAKPLNVQEATFVETDSFRGELATMLQRQFYSDISQKMALFPPREQQDGHSDIVDIDGSLMRGIEHHSEVMSAGDILPSGLALPKSSYREDGKPSVSSRGDDVVPHFALTREFSTRWQAIFNTFPFENREKLAQEFGRIRILAGDEHNKPHGIKPRQKILKLSMLKEFEPSRPKDWKRLFWEGRPIFHLNSRDHSDAKEKRPWRESITKPDLTSESGALAILASVLAGIYGGIHLTVWGQAFPSYVEEVMWKVSCLLIICFLPFSLSFLAVCLYFGDSPESDDTPDYQDRKVYWAVEVALGILIILSLPALVLIPLAHVAARAFIIVESFLSLRQVPVGVFVTPEWVELFPHF